MILSNKIRKLVMDQEGWTRKMFEAGIRMKKEYGAENVYDFSLGNPDIEPPAACAPGSSRRWSAHGGDAPIHAEQRVRVGARGNRGLPLRAVRPPFTAMHVFMTVGCAGGLNILFKAMLEQGRRDHHCPRPSSGNSRTT